ncbi:MAG: MOSC domain-containing protein [Verrucomicrobiota bacterium]
MNTNQENENARQAAASELEAGLDKIRQAPRHEGVVEMIVRRPNVGEREVLAEAALDLIEGLIGDTWKTRGSSRTPDGSSNTECQITIMNSRVIGLLAQKESWPLAGDQLFVDLDLSQDNLPAGTRLAIGSAVLEISEHPHLGCKKFLTRFGADALKFVNSPLGRQLRLRGLNARIVIAGKVRVGDSVKKL